ncbi:MAG: amidohydrolase [Crocinitomicaceae bacterium]|nr:amidohydrolase [Crocinitomicaceae bacterium]MBK8926126.1 amidohydrolase [Crocinitomicaceae bacterium]
MENIQQRVHEIRDEIIAIRRHLHQHPELSFEEVHTSAYIQSKLREWGIPFQAGIAGTGVVGMIHANTSDDTCIALRADMDALPIFELNEVDYKSIYPGKMHACGHDVHTAILLGTAKVLQEYRHELKKSVKLIFQPGEEKLPGGAKLMIEAGVLENPKVEKIVALHVFPEMETGKVGLKSGMYMASCDELHITVYGKGGHAAMPKLNIDPVLIASKLVVALHELPAAHCPENTPCVLAIGRIEGLGATNVIPDYVTLQGTFRTMNEKWRIKAHELITETAKKITQASGASVDITIERGYPYLENDPDLTEQVRSVLKSTLGEHAVEDLPIRMTGEDFSFYAHKVPATFIRLGVRNEQRGIVHGVHNARFDIDENALSTGIVALLSIVDTNI